MVSYALKQVLTDENKNVYHVQLKATDTSGNTSYKKCDSKSPDVAETVSGKVIDGYVAGATIFQDLDNDNVLDPGEPNTKTTSTGSFSLSGVIASPNAPIKMITGFDIGTNEAIVTTLGAPSTGPGTILASPIGTLIYQISDNEEETSLSTITDRVLTYLDVSSASQANINVLSDDPLVKMQDSNTSIANAAKDVFEAGQLTMALAHLTEQVGEYLTNNIDSAVQTALSNASISGYSARGSSSLSDYTKIAADAFMAGLSSQLSPVKSTTSSNAFQIDGTNLIFNDYDTSLSLSVANRATMSTQDHRLQLTLVLERFI